MIWTSTVVENEDMGSSVRAGFPLLAFKYQVCYYVNIGVAVGMEIYIVLLPSFRLQIAENKKN